MTFVHLNIGVHIKWKGSEVSAQLDRGAGMCTSGWRFSVIAWPLFSYVGTHLQWHV